VKNRFVLSIFVPTALVASLVVMPWGRRAHAADSAAGDCLAASAASLRLDSQHRVRAERAELLKCAAPACPADIKKECIRRVDDVTAAIPSIMFDVKDGEGNDLSAITVTMDAEILTDRLEGIALAVDPGAHLFTFEAAGHAPVRKQFVIREGEKRRLEVITFGPRGAAGPASGAHDAVSVEAGAAGRSPSGSGASLSSAASSPGAANGTLSGSASHSSNVAPLLAAGVGVAGLAVGSVFGLRALSKRNDARKSCPDLCTDENGVSQWNDAKRAGTVSTVAFAIGGAGVAGALILWLTARPESSEVAAGRQPQVTVGLGNIGMRGQW
jgi:hypothetical protein